MIIHFQCDFLYLSNRWCPDKPKTADSDSILSPQFKSNKANNSVNNFSQSTSNRDITSTISPNVNITEESVDVNIYRPSIPIIEIKCGTEPL